MRPDIIAAFILLIALRPACFSQDSPKKMTKEEYIELYKNIAVKEMNEFGIPASITLAQGILESSHGNSPLAIEANNHFGIKCHKEWTGDTFQMDDDNKNECFRKYSNAEESYNDHSLFLTTRERYFFLFDIDITDYKAWANGLKQAGYATNPNYPSLLVKIIEDFQLYELDKKFDKVLTHEKHLAEKEIVHHNFTSNEEDFEPISISATNRKVYKNNGVKFIYARQGDTFEKIAQDFEIYTFQVYKNNDLRKKDKLQEGQVIYLEPKKNRAVAAFHEVQPGETMYSIAQQYAIKLKKLCKYNTLDRNATLFPDQKIKLR
jgi:LysM repeat protein